MRLLAVWSAAALAVGGACQSAPPQPLLVEPGVVSARSLQTRTYEGRSEIEVQRACISLLQDLGFFVDESEPELGMLLGSKQRDAKELGQYLAKVLVWGFGYDTPVDTRQRLHVSVITYAEGSDDETIDVRVVFQRIVWNDHRQISFRERIDEPEYYQEFFQRLAQALFLEEETS